MVKLLISFVFFIGILLLFSSCEEENVYVIPEGEMIEILVDVHVADGILNTESYPYDVLELRPENFYKNILECRDFG